MQLTELLIVLCIAESFNLLLRFPHNARNLISSIELLKLLIREQIISQCEHMFTPLFILLADPLDSFKWPWPGGRVGEWRNG